MEIKKGAKVIAILALISMAVSVYLVYLHYANDSGVCDISEELNCGAVNKSEWSEIFGIPVAVFGFLTFVLLFIINLFILRDKKEFSGFELTNKRLTFLQLIILSWSILYSYGFLLLYVEFYKLKGTYCLFCLILDVLILIMFIISILMYKEVVKSGSKKIVWKKKKSN